jgi:F0F1-type ATP synthase assembly protein I
MEPSKPRAFPPVEAGAFLVTITLLSIGIGTLIGWLAGALKIGLIVGAVVGIPAGISGVYIRYHQYFA